MYLLKIIIIFNILQSGLSSFKLFTKNYPYNFKYVHDILRVYPGFEFVVHLENRTSTQAEFLIDYVHRELKKPVTIINYDNHNNSVLLRPYTIRLVNLVILSTPRRFTFYSNVPLNIILYDVVIFLLINYKFEWRQSERRTQGRFKWDRNDLEPPFWQLLDLKFAGKVIFIATAGNSTVAVYNKCYYCGKQERYLKLQERSEGCEANISKKELMPSSFDNLQGYSFRVSYLEYFPYMFCEKIKTKIVKTESLSVCERGFGSEAHLLQTLSKKLNFKYTLVAEGSIYNGSYTTVFKKVMENTIDFAIGGITLTKERNLKATFTKALRFEDYTLLYMCRMPIWNSSLLLIYPFQEYLWIVVLVSLAIVTTCLYVFMKISSCLYGVECSSLFQCFFFAVRSILEQSSQYQSNRIRSRFSHYILLVMLWFTCMEIDTLYKSKLSSMLIWPSHHEPNDLHELLEANYGIVIDYLKTETLWDILDLRDPIIREAKRHMVGKHNLCEVISYILTHKTAMLSEFSVAQYNTQYLCGHLFQNTEAFRRLRIASSPLRVTHHAWPMQKGVPFWRSFNKVIDRLQNGGFLEKWKRDYLWTFKIFNEIPGSIDNAVPDRADTVSLTSYFSPFLIYALGNVLAFTCFVGEICIYTAARKVKNWGKPRGKP